MDRALRSQRGMDPQLKAEVRFLTTRLGDVVREQAGARVFDEVEAIRKLAKAIRAADPQALSQLEKRVKKLSRQHAYDVGHAFSLFFQVVNAAEERARLRHLKSAASP